MLRVGDLDRSIKFYEKVISQNIFSMLPIFPSQTPPPQKKQHNHHHPKIIIIIIEQIVIIPLSAYVINLMVWLIYICMHAYMHIKSHPAYSYKCIIDAFEVSENYFLVWSIRRDWRLVSVYRRKPGTFFFFFFVAMFLVPHKHVKACHDWYNSIHKIRLCSSNMIFLIFLVSLLCRPWEWGWWRRLINLNTRYVFSYDFTQQS